MSRFQHHPFDIQYDNHISITNEGASDHVPKRIKNINYY